MHLVDAGLVVDKLTKKVAMAVAPFGEVLLNANTG